MSQSELVGLTPQDYTRVSGSHPMWYRTFQAIPGSNEHYLRLIIDLDDHDLELTFGPLDADQIDHMVPVVAESYVHLYANNEGPGYESGIAIGLERWEVASYQLVPIETEEDEHG